MYRSTGELTMIDFLRNRISVRLLVAVAMLAGCNLFNPSGTGPSREDEADYWIEEGQSAMQKQQFQTAYRDFSKALALDSSKSLAWHGLAKSSLAGSAFDVGELVSLGQRLQGAPDSAKLDSLIAIGDTGLTNIYLPIMRVAQIYSMFLGRDTTGRTDKVFGSHLVRAELDAILNSKVYFYLMDANRDTIIQRAELAALELMNLASGSIGIDAGQLASQGGMDSTTGALPDTTRDKINTIFANVANIVDDSVTFNKLVGGSGDTTSGDATSSMNQDARSFLQKLGSSTRFFLVNDSLDNDGDGCVSEEIYGDSLDNDADSLIEEDGRIGLRRYNPTADSLAMLSPDDGILNTALQAKADTLVFIVGNDDYLPLPLPATGSMVWADTTALLKPYKNLKWVRWDDRAVGNDTIYRRVLKENSLDTTWSPSVVRDTLAMRGKSYQEFLILAIAEVRKKVLAVPKPIDRIRMGRKLVGGCWNNVTIP
jgi:tetratricopeptide (TPR) repeat protein